MSGSFHALQILEVSKETEKAVCVLLAPPESLAKRFEFRQGQYLTLQAHIDGQRCTRSYSICSRAGERALRVAIKQVEGGVFSTWAQTNLRAGQTIDALPPAGSFYTELKPTHQKHYLCIAAGSGITPVLSNIKTILHEEPRSRLTLIYGNQRTATIMFKEELCFLKNRYLARFNWINILSREQQDAEVLCGRINNRKGAELSRKGLIKISSFDEFFLCGPEAMISEVSRGLRAEGVSASRIHYELFFASADDARQVIEKHHARAAQHAGQTSRVTITIDGRSSLIELNADGENILDAAIDAGLEVPYSCKGGVCATCKARLIAGEVDMDLNHALSTQDLARGLVLTCQAHPISNAVSIDFDAV